jgi:integrase
MPKIIKPLSAIEVNRINRVGWHAVGGVTGLLLQVRKPTKIGAPVPKSWILRLTVGNKRHPIGLGSFPQVSLAEAREMAKQMSLEAKQGINPLQKRRAKKSALIAEASKKKTFKQCAEAYIESHSTDYRNDKHRKQWATTLVTYVYPIIGNMLVSDLSMRNIKDVLLQETIDRDSVKGSFWSLKNETAKRTLDRIRVLLDYAIVNEYRDGSNPAIWKGYLDTLLPSPKGLKKVKHHPAVPYQMVGDFMLKLRANDSISARCLEFLVMTAVRSGSVRQAEWSEIDLKQRVWTIPGEHTKSGKEHRVPLSMQAIKLLEMLPQIEGNPMLFPSPRGKGLSDMALSQLMKGMRERGEISIEGVPHGFRSTFRDWAAEQTAYPDEIRKVASGHSVGDQVKEAYQRTDLLEKRRRLMDEWSNYLDQPTINDSQGASVTPIRNRG